MFCNTKNTFCFVIICLLSHTAKSQVLNGTNAEERTLKHLVYIHAHFSYNVEGIERQTSTQGAGTIVKYNWVLTAAHVVADFSKVVNGIGRHCTYEKMKLVAGVKDINDDGENSQVLEISKSNSYIVIHEFYNPKGLIYDVALINVGRKHFRQSDTVEPARRLKIGTKIERGVKCVVQGWGYNNIIKNRNGNLQYTWDEPTTVARQGYLALLGKERTLFSYGCKTGTCSQAAPGDSGAPVVCALDKDQDPADENYGYVFAVHSKGCNNLKRKCSAYGLSQGTDVRLIANWISDKTGEEGDDPVSEGTRAMEGLMKHLVKIDVVFSYVENRARREETFSGAGTVVNYNWVLTAAHLVASSVKVLRNGVKVYCKYESMRITAGAKDVNAANMQIFTTNNKNNDIITHGLYDPLRLTYDVALINLAKNPFKRSTVESAVAAEVEPAKLLEIGAKFERGVKCVVQGWGYNKVDHDGNNNLQFTLVPTTVARQGKLDLLGENGMMFSYGCGTESFSRAAPGESGAPIVCAVSKNQDPVIDGFVFAIHSHGCTEVGRMCTADDPSYGTDVRVIAKWVREKTGENKSLTALTITNVGAKTLSAIVLACFIGRSLGYL